MTNDDPPEEPLDAKPRGWGIALAVLIVLAAATVTLVVGTDRGASPGTPQATVRGFLTSAVVDANPVSACGYLTPRARKSFRPQDCATFVAGSHLDLGGLSVDSGAALGRLAYTSTPDGSARIVRVSHDGGRLTFVLRPASPEARAEFAAPPTAWRIDSSVAALA